MPKNPTALDIHAAAGLFRMLSDPTRLAIVRMVSERGEMNVSAMSAELGMSQVAVSHHLISLRLSGTLVDRRQGRQVFYSAAQPKRTSQVIGRLFAAMPAASVA